MIETVVKLGGSLAADDTLRGWIEAVEARAGRIAIVPGGGPFADAVREAQPALGFDDNAAHEMALLAMSQYGLALCSLGARLVPAETIAAIDDAARMGLVPVWMPARLLRDETGIAPSWDVTSDSLAVWLATRLAAAQVILVKSRPAPHCTTPASLSADGLVDTAFPRFAARFPGRIDIAGPGEALPAITIDA